MKHENGWLSVVPPPDAWARALERTRIGDLNTPNDLVNYASEEKRAQGHLGEEVFSRWLMALGVAFVYDGGTNPYPDFVIAGVGTALRTCARVGGEFAMHHLVYIFVTHLNATPERFFVGYEAKTGRFVLLGGIETRRFVEESEFVEQGGSVCPGFVAAYDLRRLRVSHLESPLAWLDRIIERSGRLRSA